MRRAEYALLAKMCAAAVTIDDGLVFLVHTSDRVVGAQLFSGNYVDVGVAPMSQTLAQIADILGRDCVRDRVFVDVGANIGTTSIAAVARFGARRVISFEPDESNYRLLRCNAILNGVEEKVSAYRAAVSAQPGTLALEISPHNSGDNRVRTGRGQCAADGQFDERKRELVDVEVVRLDSVVGESRLSADEIGLVWIDVQGHEAHVLEGAGVLLGRVPTVVEYGPYWLDRAGGLDTFHTIVGDAYEEVVDLHTSRRMRSRDVSDLEAEYTGLTYTDLLLVPHA